MEPVPISRVADGAGRSWIRLLCVEGSLVLRRRDLLLKKENRRKRLTTSILILSVSNSGDGPKSMPGIRFVDVIAR
jgi:hypothetical protein